MTVEGTGRRPSNSSPLHDGHRSMHKHDPGHPDSPLTSVLPELSKSKNIREESSGERAAKAPKLSDRQEEQPPQSQSSPGPKALPPFYFDCDTPDLLVLISSMLGELIALNDAIPLVPSQLTRFHSRAPPLISHQDYLRRITRFCSLEKSALLSIVFYIDLLCAAFSSFTINSLTVHRFLITAATVASKGLCDSFCTNAHYARVGGVSLPELNLLEVEFLVRVGWRVVPAVNTLEEYYRRMIGRLSQVYKLADLKPAPSLEKDTTDD